MSTPTVLQLHEVVAGYGPSEVLHKVTLDVHEGETVCLLGSNAAGKSTTLRTILGLVRTRTGTVTLRGEPIQALTTPEIVAKGITMVPENRRLFAKMTVRENLEIGANLRKDKAEILQDMDRMFSLFPRLKERIAQRAGTLSGGEQQMLAIGRGLMANPRILLLDEPSMGLAPILVQKIFETIVAIRKQGVAVLLVEQNAFLSLQIADYGYVIETGEIALEGKGQNLLNNAQVKESYLG